MTRRGREGLTVGNYLVELRRQRERTAALTTPEVSAKPTAFSAALTTDTDPPEQTAIRRVVGRLGALGEGLDEDAQRALIQALVLQEGDGLSRAQLESIQTEVLSALGGRLGPLQPLVEDPSVTEVMVNGPKQVYVEREGHLMRTEVTFRDDRSVQALVERIVLPLGRQFNVRNPMVDARLPDGSRVNAVRPPVSLLGTTLNIRRFPKAYRLSELVENGAFGAGQRWQTPPREDRYPVEAPGWAMLAWAVHRGVNVMISGATSSGKTTLLGALTECIPEDRRVIFIEDAAELAPRLPHVVRLESRRPNAEGIGEVSIRALVVNALRQRPDRIVIGEVRDIEVLDMLQALNTGHRGSLATIHANAPDQVFLRLVQMATMRSADGTAVTRRTIQESAARALHLIVHVARVDGRRCVDSISSVDPPGTRGEPSCTELYRRDGDALVATARRPRWIDSDGRLLV